MQRYRENSFLLNCWNEWTRVKRARNPCFSTGDTRVYTGSGLRRVKPYVQLSVVVLLNEQGSVGSPRRVPHAALYGQQRATSQWTWVQVGYNMENNLNWTTLLSRDIRTGGRRCTTSGVLPCTPSLVEVFRSVNKVIWAYMQVDGSSPTCRAHPSGTLETLVGGNPWYPCLSVVLVH
jgi:hypothetical protein